MPGRGAPADGRRRSRVVVVGGGFAGLAAVRSLRHAHADVLVLDRKPYSTFQPLLYQVATGGLNPGDVSYALRAVAGHARNARVRQAAVTAVDARNRRVRTDTGEDVEYDYLVRCCGVGASFFGVPGADVHARTIYTRGDAVALRDHLFTSLEAAAQGRPGQWSPSSSSSAPARRVSSWRARSPSCGTRRCR